MKRDDSRQARLLLINQIRAILRDKWDPVGVGDNPALRDEYDAYLAYIARMLEDSATTTTAISDYLMHIEIDKMGLPGDPARRLSTSEALIQLVKSG